MKKDFTIIALGGSLIVPQLSDKGGINVSFLRQFRKLLLQEIRHGKRFVLIVGGGKTARVYQKAVIDTVGKKQEDLDWIGVHATKLNAELLLSIFKKEAYFQVISDAISKKEMDKAKKSKNSIFIASGGTPGCSTDTGAVLLAQEFGAKEVIVAGNTPFVYEKDPRQNRNAKSLPELIWSEYQELIPKKWSPGLSTPVDPVAAKLARKIGLTAKIIQGTNLLNFKKAIEGKSFRGTLITPKS